MQRQQASGPAALLAHAPSSQVQIFAPVRAGNGSYRITAGVGGKRVGSVMVHERGQSSIEVTHLGVDAAFRKQSVGTLLMASAMRAGLQLGKKDISLASQDNGSGRLTNWYRNMGFAQVGVHPRGYPLMRAPINRILSGVMQGRMAAVPSQARPGAAPVANRRHGVTVQRAVNHVIQRADFFVTETKNRYSGRNDSGVVFGGSPSLRSPHSYASDENARFLRYLSNYFFHYVNAFCKAKDAEVEAMFLSDRLVISANNPKTMKVLFEMMKKEQTLLDVLQTQLPNSIDTRGTTMAERFYGVISRPDPRSEAARLLQWISFEDIEDVVRLIEVTRLRDAITSDAFSGKLILLSGLGIHAEQKLLLALVEADPTRTIQVAIRGKKRPCFGCWLCLTFAREVLGYVNLNYNTRPGKAWVQSISSIDRLIAKARQLGVKDEDLQKWFDQKKAQFSKVKTYVSVNPFGEEDPGYDSYSDDEPY